MICITLIIKRNICQKPFAEHKLYKQWNAFSCYLSIRKQVAGIQNLNGKTRQL